MIIEADFLNHWKVKALGNAVGELAAIRALISLWGHCQKRRAWEFLLTPAKLAGICDFHGDKAAIDQLWSWMKELEFIDPAGEPGWFQVHQWGEVNVSLVAKWAAGSKLKACEFPPRGTNATSKALSKAPSSDLSLDPSLVPTIGEDRIGLDGIGEDRTGISESSMQQQSAEAFAWNPETGWVGITEAVVDELAAAFPACHIRRQMLVMEQWLKANPQKARKHNWRRFVTNWLKNEQDRGGDLHLSPPTRSDSGNGSFSEKKEKGPRPADFPWRAVAEDHEGWTPSGDWTDQTPRSRRQLRETWNGLPAATKAALYALNGDEKKEGGTTSEP